MSSFYTNHAMSQVRLKDNEQAKIRSYLK